MQRAKSGIAGLGDRLRRSRSHAIASPGVAGFCCFSASPDAGWLFAVLGTPHVWVKKDDCTRGSRPVETKPKNRAFDGGYTGPRVLPTITDEIHVSEQHS